MSRSDGAVVVDLVREQVEQRCPDKLDVQGIRVDPPEQILANKLNTVVSRAEERDLVDLMLLERAGHRVEEALDAALRKDGACTPANLAWVLSQISIRDGAALPAGVNAGELRAYLSDLIARLVKLARPG